MRFKTLVNIMIIIILIIVTVFFIFESLSFIQRIYFQDFRLHLYIAIANY